LLLFGLLFGFLWMVSEYVGLIFEEVRRRPIYVVAQTKALDGRLRAGSDERDEIMAPMGRPPV
jgi:hypothetical protein